MEPRQEKSVKSIEPKGLKHELMDLIVRFGKVKAVGVKKPVSNRTQDWREHALFLMFKELKEMGYKLESPYGFRESHLKKLVANWEEKRLSAATIQNRISVARTFATWIGKPGMIRDSHLYCIDKRSVTRQSVASHDKSWSAAGIDVGALIGMVSQTDHYVGMQMQIMLAFGLRREEAVMFKPHRADYTHYIIVRDGTKGGRERSITISNVGQRNVLDAAKAMVKRVDGHIGHPDRTLKQSLRRFNYVMECHGITRGHLGITSHGLRHQRLNDLYEEIAGVPSPVRQANADSSMEAQHADPMLIDLARARVSSEAGHTRLCITSAYTGAVKSTKKSALDWSPEGMSDDWRRLQKLSANGKRTAEEETEFCMLKNRLIGASDTVPAETA